VVKIKILGIKKEPQNLRALFLFIIEIT